MRVAGKIISRSIKILRKNYLTNFVKSIDELSLSYKDTIELLEITDENEDKGLYLELEDALKLYEKKWHSLPRDIIVWRS